MKRAAWLAAGSISAGAGAILAGIGLMTASGYLVARASERPPIVDLMLVFVAVRFFGLTRPALRYAERLASHELTFRVLTAVRTWFVGALLPLSLGQLISYRSGDLLSRMASDVNALQEGYLRVIAPGLVAVVVSTVTVMGFSLVDGRIAAVVFVLLAAYGIGWSYVAYRQSRSMGARRNDVRRRCSADLVATIQGIDDVLACGYEGEVQATFARYQQQWNALERRDGWTLAVHAAAATAFTMLAAWAVLVLSLQALNAAQLSQVWIAPLMLATVASFESVEGLPAAWQSAAQTRESARRVLEVVHTPPAVAEVTTPVPIGNAVPGVEFDRVAFGYGPSSVLDDVNVRIEPGEHVAVVGPTGAGKSTLIALVSRGWDPRAGTVRINGVDLREADLDDLRAHTAVLPQQVHVFNDTLRENARLGCRRASDGAVLDALTRAGLAPFLSRAPQGLDTVLGEHGTRMSAGERQRLGLARLLLTDATLVLVDEPTAHLDAGGERHFLDALCSWAEHRTLLIVSHSPAALAHVNRVLTIDHGRVIESATGTRIRA